MKKHLIAAAVAGVLAAPAMAQVTVYGIVEINLKDGSGNGDLTSLGTSLHNSSRLGFKGEEDLGGGMKAGFRLETRLDPVNGTIVDGNSAGSGELFERGAEVYLTGGFGKVQIGKFDHIGGEDNDQAYFGGAGLGNQMLISGNVEIGSDADGSIGYTTPSMGGFTFNVTHSLKDNSSGTAGDTNTHDGITTYALRGSVAGVSLKLGAGEEKETDGSKTKVQGVSVGSDLGVAKASLAYQKAEVAGSDRKYTILNVSAPLGGLTLAGSYAKYDAATGDYDMTQIGLIKALSKRTNIIGMYQSKDPDGGSSTSLTSVSVAHSF
jgi:predicted porin